VGHRAFKLLLPGNMLVRCFHLGMECSEARGPPNRPAAPAVGSWRSQSCFEAMSLVPQCPNLLYLESVSSCSKDKTQREGLTCCACGWFPRHFYRKRGLLYITLGLLWSWKEPLEIPTWKTWKRVYRPAEGASSSICKWPNDHEYPSSFWPVC
jgi:hypothetical protein